MTSHAADEPVASSVSPLTWRPLCIVQGEEHFLLLRKALPLKPFHQSIRVSVFSSRESTPCDTFDLGVEQVALATVARHRSDLLELLAPLYDFHAQQLAADRLLTRSIGPTHLGTDGSPDLYLIDPVRFRYGRIAIIASRERAR